MYPTQKLSEYKMPWQFDLHLAYFVLTKEFADHLCKMQWSLFFYSEGKTIYHVSIATYIKTSDASEKLKLNSNVVRSEKAGDAVKYLLEGGWELTEGSLPDEVSKAIQAPQIKTHQ